MTLKCTKQQFEALYMLFERIMAEHTTDMAGSLQKDLMEPIYEKLRKRMRARVAGNKGWNLTLTPLQAKSYYVFFEGIDLQPNYTYEHYIISSHLNEINKIYA